MISKFCAGVMHLKGAFKCNLLLLEDYILTYLIYCIIQ